VWAAKVLCSQWWTGEGRKGEGKKGRQIIMKHAQERGGGMLHMWEKWLGSFVDQVGSSLGRRESRSSVMQQVSLCPIHSCKFHWWLKMFL